MRQKQVKQDRQSNEGRRTVAWPIKLFFFFHALMITVWSLPYPSFDVASGQVALTPATFFTRFGDWVLLVNAKYLKPNHVAYYRATEERSLKAYYDAIPNTYMARTGLWQYWDMFAPNPASVDFWVDAIVLYEDGSYKVYQYPRMYELGILEKYFKERYRKYYERVNADEFSWRWPSFAQRIALLSYVEPDNPPVEVTLRRHWRVIQPPGEETQYDYNSYLFYKHPVDQEKLLQDAQH